MPDNLILLTKRFPFGHQETYLFDEIPYLIQKFKKITIVPYDEYEYEEGKNRVKENKQVEIFKINKERYAFSLVDKLKRECAINYLILQEIIRGREKFKHFVKYPSIASQLRHMFLNGKVLANFVTNHTQSNDKVIFYNYWLHRGVIISSFAKSRLSNPVKIISRAHAYDLYHNDWLNMLNIKTKMFLPLEYFKMNGCDHIFSISSHGLKHFKKHFKQFTSKFSIARLGVKDHMTEANLKDANDIKLILSCSAIDDRKRVYLMPEILSHLNFKFKWIHIGGGATEHVEKVNFHIKKYNLEDHCELKGLMPHHQIIELYKTTSVNYFINLSVAEGIPVSLMEAASFGVPMIATDTIGNPEIVNNENGFLIDVDFNPLELANRMNTCNSNANTVKSKREASRQMFLKNYSAAKNYVEFAELLSQN